MIVTTVSPTIQDGTVVRWYTEASAKDRRPIVSASRNSVVVDMRCPSSAEVATLTRLIGLADQAMRTLKVGGSVDHLATHEMTRDGVRMLEPADPLVAVP